MYAYIRRLCVVFTLNRPQPQVLYVYVLLYDMHSSVHHIYQVPINLLVFPKRVALSDTSTRT